MNNYVRKYHLCPGYISRLFDDVSTHVQLENAVSAVVAWRLNNTLLECWEAFELAELIIASSACQITTARSSVSWSNELTRIDSRLCDYFTAVRFLLVASKALRHGFNDEFMDILATTVGHFIEPRRYSINSKSEISLIQSTKLMKVVANYSRSTVQLMEIDCPRLICTER